MKFVYICTDGIISLTPQLLISFLVAMQISKSAKDYADPEISFVIVRAESLFWSSLTKFTAWESVVLHTQLWSQK